MPPLATFINWKYNTKETKKKNGRQCGNNWAKKKNDPSVFSLFWKPFCVLKFWWLNRNIIEEETWEIFRISRWTWKAKRWWFFSFSDLLSIRKQSSTLRSDMKIIAWEFNDCHRLKPARIAAQRVLAYSVLIEFDSNEQVKRLINESRVDLIEFSTDISDTYQASNSLNMHFPIHVLFVHDVIWCWHRREKDEMKTRNQNKSRIESRILHSPWTMTAILLR